MFRRRRIVKILAATCAVLMLTCFTTACDNAHRHSLEYVEATLSTCTTNGNIAHWHCTKCGKDFNDESATEVLNDVKKPCTNHYYSVLSFNDDKVHYNTCAVCGYEDHNSEEEHMIDYGADENYHWLYCRRCDYKNTSEPHSKSPCPTCKYGALLYELSANGKYYICNGPANSSKSSITEFVIDDEYEGLPVREIGELAFRDCSVLKTVKFGKNIISIGDRAFLNCVALENVEMNSGLYKIEASAFSNCQAIVSIEIPETVRVIEQLAFSGCTKLQDINLPDGINVIMNNTFSNCNSLKTVKIPDSVTTIQQACFYKSGVEEIVLPRYIESIPTTMFLDCANLRSVTFTNSVESIGMAAFSGCTALETIYFYGTQEEWDEIGKFGSDFSDQNNMQVWNYNTNFNVVFLDPATLEE